MNISIKYLKEEDVNIKLLEFLLEKLINNKEKTIKAN